MRSAQNARASVAFAGVRVRPYRDEHAAATLAVYERAVHQTAAAGYTTVAERRAFVVDDETFDAILKRLPSQGVAYGSQPSDSTNGRIDRPLSDRGLFFQTPDGHLFELMATDSGEV